MTFEDAIPEGEPVPQFEPSAEQLAAFEAYAARHAGKTVRQVHGDTTYTEQCGAWDYFQEVKNTPWTPAKALHISQLVFDRQRGATLESSVRVTLAQQAAPGSPSRAFALWVMTLFPRRTMAILRTIALEEEGGELPGLTPDERAYLFTALAPHDEAGAHAMLRDAERRAAGLPVEGSI